MSDKISVEKVREAIDKLRKHDEVDIDVLNTFEELAEQYIAGKLISPMSVEEIEKIIREEVVSHIADGLINESALVIKLTGKVGKQFVPATKEGFVPATSEIHELAEAPVGKIPKQDIEQLKKENEELRKCHDAELGVCQEHCDVVKELKSKIPQGKE